MRTHGVGQHAGMARLIHDSYGSGWPELPD